jgi:GT2 family glycosyltransferase
MSNPSPTYRGESPLGQLVRLTRRLAGTAVRDPLQLLRWGAAAGRTIATGGVGGLKKQIKRRLNDDQALYERWVALYDTLTDQDRVAIRERIERLPRRPLISVVMPVYNVDEIWLRKAIDSVRRQLYPEWELCIADDTSPRPHIRRVLEEYSRLDSRIRVVFRPVNGHISAASNSALELASGEFVALLDHDDELSEHALYMVAEEINAHPDADLIYSDEDGIDEKGRRSSPHFKTDWNPDLFYSFNCISHLGVYRRSVVEAIGGFRIGYEGSQDYDIALRTIARIPAGHIRHIPRILYHWLAIPGSVRHSSSEKEYAHEAARRAIRSDLEGRGIQAEVLPGYRRFHRVVYPVPDPAPLVSLIVGTRDGLALLRQTVDGILNGTDYQPVEVVIVDNQSAEPETLEYFREIEGDPRVKIVRYDAPFNFSAINNLGVASSSGTLVGLVNNDIKVIDAGWLREMVSHALRPEIGVVGAKLYYANDTIQHAGLVLGIGGTAGHIFRKFPRESPGYFYHAQLIGNYSAMTAACMLMRRELFERAGGLDDANLPVAFNDVDLCLRIRELGYRNLWTPYAELYHLESATRGSDRTAETLPRFQREQQWFRERWGEILGSDPYYSPNLTLEHENSALAFPPRLSNPWQTGVETVKLQESL